MDPRQRLRLTKGIAHRLAVPVGGQVLVTCHVPTRTLRLISPAALADTFENAIDAATTTSVHDVSADTQSTPTQREAQR
jgi:hypothetical protein